MIKPLQECRSLLGATLTARLFGHHHRFGGTGPWTHHRSNACADEVSVFFVERGARTADHDSQHNIRDLCENVVEVCSGKRARRVARVYLPGHSVFDTQFDTHFFLLSGLESPRLSGFLHR